MGKNYCISLSLCDIFVRLEGSYLSGYIVDLIGYISDRGTDK